MSDTYRSGGRLHSLRSKDKPIEKQYSYEDAREYSGMEPTEVGFGASTRAVQNYQSGETDMGMATMGKVTGEMGGAGTILGGQQAPASAEMAGTGMPSATASMGGAEGVLGGGGGGGSATGAIMGQIGGQIGGMDDKKDAAAKQLLYDNSDVEAMSRARPTGGNMDAQALIDKARRFSTGGK